MPAGDLNDDASNHDLPVTRIAYGQPVTSAASRTCDRHGHLARRKPAERARLGKGSTHKRLRHSTTWTCAQTRCGAVTTRIVVLHCAKLRRTAVNSRDGMAVLFLRSPEVRTGLRGVLLVLRRPHPWSRQTRLKPGDRRPLWCSITLFQILDSGDQVATRLVGSYAVEKRRTNIAANGKRRCNVAILSKFAMPCQRVWSTPTTW